MTLYAPKALADRFDELLAREGRVVVLTWLEALGRVHRDDLERWRRGEGEALVSCLFGDRAAIGRELRQAGELARQRRLAIEREPRGHPSGQLPGVADDWASLVFTRPRSTAQLDLFADGGGAPAARRLLVALAAHDTATAEATLGELEQREPGHALVAAAPALLEPLGEALDTAAAAAAAWRRLEGLEALARRALGEQADAYLRRCWRRIAVAVERHPGAQHPSLAWLRAGEPGAVLRTLGDDPARLDGPELLTRGVRALTSLGRHRDALDWYFSLCWRFPEIGELQEDLADGVLDLDTALDAWFDGELQERLGWNHFPAWLVLGNWVPADAGAALPGRPATIDAARAVREKPTSLAARRALQEASAPLFRAFMNNP